MARKSMRQVNRSGRYVRGNLAYDYDYLEREERRRAERMQREYAQRRMRETRPHPTPGKRIVEQAKHRERIRVSSAIILGFSVAAVMVVALLMSYARLSVISHEVVQEQKYLAALEEEHVKLVARYEKTFDLTSIKETAEATGMAKPSASQIYYIDLSAPDNVVLYERESNKALSRVFTSVGHNIGAIMEYFK